MSDSTVSFVGCILNTNRCQRQPKMGVQCSPNCQSTDWAGNGKGKRTFRDAQVEDMQSFGVQISEVLEEYGVIEAFALFNNDAFCNQVADNPLQNQNASILLPYILKTRQHLAECEKLFDQNQTGSAVSYFVSHCLSVLAESRTVLHQYQLCNQIC